MALRKIPPVLAAEMMGKAPSFVYIGLQRGLLPIGTAFKKGEGRTAKYSYYISPKLFMEYTGFTEKDIIAAAKEANLEKGIATIEELAESPEEKVI